MVTNPPRPTGAELSLLKILWQHGPATVRQVMDAANAAKRGKEMGYTSVLKLMQIMAEKGTVVRDESQRTHIYRAKVSEDMTQKRMVKELLDKAYEGAASKLVMHALSGKKATQAERDAIRQLLDDMEAK